jgi:UDP-N-acetylmuramoyl-L-alanyl-D-glutamate--2,6-diaminopimelate ligase
MSEPGKRVSELLAGLAPVASGHDVYVRDIAVDSRKVTPGALFLAVRGEHHDGRAFVPDAVARGAAAVVYDSSDTAMSAAAVPLFGVPHLPRQLGNIAARFFGEPSHSLVVVGVTGTNGKTTCTQLLAQAINNSDRIGAPTVARSREGEAPWRCAVIGTLGYGFPEALEPASHTTPDAVRLQRLLANLRSLGASHVSMEVSSHALDQGRVNGMRFSVAVFTNLSRDHLDYHGDMERYGAAKALLFQREELNVAVINEDDNYGRQLIEQLKKQRRVMTYGRNRGDVRARAVDLTRDGMRVVAATPSGDVEVRAPLFGDFNVLNLLAVLATLIALEIDAADAARRLSFVQPVPGRVERFGVAGRPSVIVDYAHTPDALEQVLKALRAHARGRLWCVFGCGGNRDRGKRPLMGAIAERLADVVILTDDNPRGESGDAIVQDIIAGMKLAPRVIRERSRAIATAIAEAGVDDVVLIAGKGHEDYQEIGDVRHAYSDRDTVRSLLEGAA